MTSRCRRCGVLCMDPSEGGHYMNLDHAPRMGLLCTEETAERHVPDGAIA